MFNFIKSVDLFGAQVPNFNIGGRYLIKTWTGSLFSIVIMLLRFIFGLLKLDHLAQRKNPTVITSEEVLDEGSTYDITQDEFMVAFAA